ncbi:metallophosphoesterase [Actinoplanes sp. NPDC048796]|uniref:metallophosphoesterase n=1 Tax=Actinoplanes sp. NPDC048796 TaxID=3155640 RepID=UPI0033CD3E59
MAAFVGLIFVVVGLVHFYLWKRLVKDPMRSRTGRRVGAVIAVVLAVLVPTTLIGVRSGAVQWLAWPGYLWIALMFYLLVTLAVLEIPRLAILLTWRFGRRGTAAADADATDAEPVRIGSKATPAERGTPPEAGAPEQTAAPGEGALGQAAVSDERALTPGYAPASECGDGGEGGEGGDAERSDQNEGGIDRRLVLARGVAIFAGLTAASVTGYGVKTALGGPRIDRLQMPLAKVPRSMDGFRMAVVSDIHLGPLTGVNHARRIVDQINSVQADIVCVVGDLVDGSVAELGRFAAPLAEIESRHGAFFVTGNHEYYSGYQEWVEEVARLGMRPLRNERVEINGLDLAGVNDLGGAEHGDAPDFARALGDRDTARPVVLMAHQPVAVHDAAPFGVDLQVSGHTHGGQMAPFNLLVRLQQPVVSGLGRVDGVPVYVTNGAGFWGPPVRVGAPPQVSVIELRSK